MRRVLFVAAIALGVLFAALVILFQTDVLNTYRVPSPAMEPALRLGDKFVTVWFNFPFRGEPRRGDIVVFRPPLGADTSRCAVESQPADGHPCSRSIPGRSANFFVRRVVGLPGETIAIRGNRAIVDGRRLDERSIRTDPCELLCNLPKTITVPDGQYFMLGDNRGASDDSRSWGPVPANALVGRKVLGY